MKPPQITKPPRPHSGTCHTDQIWLGTLAILQSLLGMFPNSRIETEISVVRIAGGVHGNLPVSAVSTQVKPCHAAAFTKIERISDNVLAISWRDSTLGSYDEQRWRKRVSRIRGICALSGSQIKRGSVVYVPVTRGRHTPCNADAMILESAVVSKVAGAAPR